MDSSEETDDASKRIGKLRPGTFSLLSGIKMSGIIIMNSVNILILGTFLLSCESKSVSSESKFQEPKSFVVQKANLSDNIILNLDKFKQVTGLWINLEMYEDFNGAKIEVFKEKNVKLFSYHVLDKDITPKRKEAFFSDLKKTSCTVNGKASRIFVYDGFEFFPGCGLNGDLFIDSIDIQNINLFYDLFNVHVN